MYASIGDECTLKCVSQVHLLTVSRHIQLDEVLKVVNFRRQILDFVVAQSEFPQSGQTEEVLGQVSQVIGVQEEFLEGSGVSEEVVGDGGQGAMPLVHVLHLTVTPFEDGDALEHCCCCCHCLLLLLYV